MMETLGSSNSFLPLKKRMSLTLGDTPVIASAKDSGNTKYKGVVKLHNGRWGAQLYTHHQRIWLGTFKSAAEAAMAYDSASVKLGTFDDNLYRNFPCSDSMEDEREFQERYTTEAVLDMIRDGSYPQEFRDFLRIRSQNVTNINTVGSKDEKSNKCFSCRQLFQKELTLSDVGKLNRLVIPKKYAVKYLPSINVDKSETEEGEIRGDVEEVEVVCYDRAMRQWKFRYCYWTSSQSFVFTRGWIGFVKEKQLKEKDVVVFYSCNVKTLEGTSNNFLMIDIVNFSDNGLMVPEEVNMMVLERDVEVLKIGNGFSSKLEDEEKKLEEKKGGVYAIWC